MNTSNFKKLNTISRINYIEKNKQKIREMSDCAARVKSVINTSNLNNTNEILESNEQTQVIVVKEPYQSRLNSDYLKKIRPKTVTSQNKENSQPNNITLAT